MNEEERKVLKEILDAAQRIAVNVSKAQRDVDRICAEAEAKLKKGERP
jgi:hypothetical protein